MRFRQFLFVVFLLTGFSCKNQPSGNGVVIDPVTDNVGILGAWTLCSTYSNGMVTQSNVCPTIVFEMNGTGKKIMSNDLVEEFSWMLKNKILTIQYPRESFSKLFAYTNYIVYINKKETPPELTISHSRKDLYYTLSRKIE